MDNPNINLEKLSEPITRLIEVISKGVGTLYAPFGTVRQAKADSAAKIIFAKGEIEVAGLIERANARVEYREILRQKNIEKISEIAAHELPKEVSPEMPNHDWILQFFDCAQDVCEEDIQVLWGRILAGEVASPGSYAKRTLQFLRTIDKLEAEKFTQLCSFSITNNEGWRYLVSDKQTFKEVTKSLGPKAYIEHFISIGLLLPTPNYLCASSVTGIEASYFGKKYVFNGPPKPPDKQILPKIELFCKFFHFSSVGQELAKIAGATKIEGYVERLSDSLNAELKISLNEQN